MSLSSLTHSTVCPTLIVIFSGINLCSAVILTTTTSDSWGAAGIAASTYTAVQKISVAQMEIASLSVENICAGFSFLTSNAAGSIHSFRLLVATIEEEFGIEIDIQDLEELVSFDKILDRVLQKATNV